MFLSFALVGFFYVVGIRTYADSGRKLTLAAGSEKGLYYNVAKELSVKAQQFEIELDVLKSSGSVENLYLVSQNKAQLCIAQGDTVFKACMGVQPFSESITNIQVVGSLYTEAVHILIRAPLYMARIEDFKGKRISVGPEGGGTEANARAILDAAGIAQSEVTILHLRIEEVAEAMKEEKLDVAFFTSGYPLAAISNLVHNKRVTLFEPPVDSLQRVLDAYPFYVITSIPAGTYLGDEITTLGVPALLLVRRDVETNLVYDIAKIACAGKSASAIAAIQNDFIPISPGARQFYKDAGVYRMVQTSRAWNHIGLPALGGIFVLMLLWKLSRIRVFLKQHSVLRVFIALFFIWVIGAFVLYSAEHRINENYGNLWKACWSTLMNWLNFGSKEPFTMTGRITSVTMTVLGAGGIVWVTGEIATIFVKRQLGPKWRIMQLKEHYVIINWNDKGQGIIEQLRNSELSKKPIVVVAKPDKQPACTENHLDIYYLSDPNITEAKLKQANIERAKAVLILADKLLEPAAADAETILIMLTVSKLCEQQRGHSSQKHDHDLTIVAEIMQPQNVALAEFVGKDKHGRVEIVSSQHLAQDLMAQVAVTPGLTKIYHDLLTFGANTNEIYSCKLGGKFDNKTLEDLFCSVAELRRNCNVHIIPVAILRNGEFYVNPTSERIGLLQRDDEVYAICDNANELNLLT